MSRVVTALRRTPVDPTSAERQARMRARLGSPIKAHLDPDLRDRLERCAARNQITLAHLLRQALDEFLEVAERHAATTSSQAGSTQEYVPFTWPDSAKGS